MKTLPPLLVASALCACNFSSSGAAPEPRPPPPPPPPEASCLGSNLLGWAGKTRLLVGISAGDTAARAASYDIRYQYIPGQLPDGPGPCARCDKSCSTTDAQGTRSCANSAGCNWWGCWQWDQDPPGAFARSFIQRAKAQGQIPMFTYYVVLPASGLQEGIPELAAVNDPSFLARYLADWKFLLQQVGQEKALLHVEPDFWGYGQHRSADPGSIPARVKAANPADCGAFDDSLAGLGRCLIAMARIYAPNARIGLHASGWGSGFDCFNAYCPDAAAEGAKVGAWLKAAGADQGDFIAGDMSDRDADWYASQCNQSDPAQRAECQRAHWWDPTNASTPSFHRVFTWARAAAEGVGRPMLWWQTPLGNSTRRNTTWTDGSGELWGEWKDNRVEYLFAHMNEVAAAHGVGVAYGAGASGQTMPETDGGLLASSTASYLLSGGAALCPP